jgi:hypothetical protein
MAKQRTSFALSEDTLKLLAKLADKNLRSMASMVEVLILEAAKKEKLKP